MSVEVTVRYNVVLDVPVGCWNETCTFEDLKKQAIGEGHLLLKRDLTDLDYKIIGTPEVCFVTGDYK